MLPLTILVVLTLFYESWALSTDPVCNKGVQGLLQPLSSYAPAQTFCTSKYPIKTTTNTAAATTATNTITAPTLITSTLTITAATSTILTTSTTTVTTTTTLTSPQKRGLEDRAINDAKATKLSSLISAAGAVLSTFCSCIEAHPQVTTTPTVTVSTTTTPYGVATSTSTPLTTSTVVVTSTTTVTTVRATPTPAFCTFNADTEDQSGTGGCKPGCYCDMHPGGSGEGVCDDASTCGTDCSSDKDCAYDEVCAGFGGGCSGRTSPRSCVKILPCGSGSASKRALDTLTFGGMERRAISVPIRRPLNETD
ncbi:hypothetical protein OPT61_g8137 [Boeremia exigua]|uniref:Uncharacterized protein n=1 Tax=Boeremia exigua TaxID=749465 RepID=A0ACC2I0H6_9PLEO|nr:hypothetical protein OPT61_g8137 [Boeremia exigua]